MADYEVLHAGAMQPLSHAVNKRVAEHRRDGNVSVLTSLASPSSPATAGSSTFGGGKEQIPQLANDMREWHRKLQRLCQQRRDGVNAAMLHECLSPLLIQAVAIILESGSAAVTACHELAVGVDATVAYIAECAADAFLIRRSDMVAVVMKQLQACIRELERLQPGGVASRSSSFLSSFLPVRSGSSATSLLRPSLGPGQDGGGAVLAASFSDPQQHLSAARAVANRLRRLAVRMLPCLGHNSFGVMA